MRKKSAYTKEGVNKTEKAKSGHKTNRDITANYWRLKASVFIALIITIINNY